MVSASRSARKGIKTVSWLTAVNHEMIERVGGLSTIRSELPMDWFALYDHGTGIVIQAGPKPEAAPVDVDPKPARLVLPNNLFRAVRAPEVSLHFNSQNGEPRLTGWSAERWLKRFDIDADEWPACKAKLLDEPTLTEQTTLPDRL